MPPTKLQQRKNRLIANASLRAGIEAEVKIIRDNMDEDGAHNNPYDDKMEKFLADCGITEDVHNRTREELLLMIAELEHTADVLKNEIAGNQFEIEPAETHWLLDLQDPQQSGPIEPTVQRIQSIPDDTTVWVEVPMDMLMEFEYRDREVLTKHKNEPARVLSLETATELGQKDYEYYNIAYSDGTPVIGISGRHLTPTTLNKGF